MTGLNFELRGRSVRIRKATGMSCIFSCFAERQSLFERSLQRGLPDEILIRKHVCTPTASEGQEATSLFV
jgi:hypothetical protein